MSIARRDYNFRIVDIIKQETVLEDEYGLSETALKKMKATWQRKSERLGWNFQLIISLI